MQNFSGVALFPFKGVVARRPIQVPTGWRLAASNASPGAVPAVIDWNVYWQLALNPANVGVTLNLQAASVQQSVLDRILAVKIDNLGSPVPVYVLFPDTGDMVSCPPNATCILPVFTNNLICNVYAVGLTAGSIPKTQILFLNIAPPPNIDPEINQALELRLASPSITRGTTILNTNYGIPALGDQAFSGNFQNVADGTTKTLWGTPYTSGFLYLVGLQVNTQGLNGGGASLGRVVIESTGAAGILYDLVWTITTQIVFYSLINRSGMNLKLDATQLWRMRQISGFGGLVNTIMLTSEFTTNPN